MNDLRAIEEWTGHRQPPRNPMKATFFIILGLIILFFALGLTGCATETTRTITTDKAGMVTDTTVTKKGTDPAAMKLVSVAAEIYLPRRPMLVSEQKSARSIGDPLRRSDRRRRMALHAPIHPFETAFRWKP